MDPKKDTTIDPGAVAKDIAKLAPEVEKVVKDIVTRVHAARAADSDGGSSVTPREIARIAGAEFATLLVDLPAILA